MPTPAPTSKKMWWRRLLRTELLCPSLRCRKRCHLPLRRGPPRGAQRWHTRCLKESGLGGGGRGRRSLRLVHRGAKRLKRVRSRSDSALAASSTSQKASHSGRRGGSQTRDPESVVTDCSGWTTMHPHAWSLSPRPTVRTRHPRSAGGPCDLLHAEPGEAMGRLPKCAASQRAAFSLPP